MKRIVFVFALAAAALTAAITVVNFYDNSLQIGRMWETPAVRPHEKPIPVMAGVSVPFEGGEALLRVADPDALTSPLPAADPEVIARGRQAYQYYCIQCHGRHYDGQGTVGQSFAPLPGDLRSARVQSFAPGRLFQEISYGIPGGRQPALATTMTVEERWQVIAFIKSLGTR